MCRYSNRKLQLYTPVKGFTGSYGKESDMKIQNSSIAMASVHHETSFSYKETMTIEAAKSKDVAGAILNLSRETGEKSIKEAMEKYQKQEKEEAKKKQQEREADNIKNMDKLLKAQKADNQYAISDDIDMKIKMLRRLLAALNGKNPPKDVELDKEGKVTDLRSPQYKMLGFISSGSINNLTGSIQIGTSQSGTTWQKITAVSGFTSESESTTFATKGFVQTEDGRSIDFNMEVSMSRAFMQETNLLEVKDYIKTDPLMINLDTDIGSVSDQKFFFDLDADGKEDSISFAGKGSGFLALDKNGDGKINDGSELFGTRSGDGFRDLATYDEDNNGWIDENDSVYNKLKVWTKDENGNDYLIDLKKADVGAIYLDNVNTQFSLKDDENNLDAEIKKTGIFLKESTGMVGTINHVDLVI